MKKPPSIDLAPWDRVSRRGILKSFIGLGASYAASQVLLGQTALAAVPSPQSPVPADLNTQTIHYDSGDVQIEAYLAKPKSPGKHPAVLLIHDDVGLNNHIRETARRFAAEGFVALAPDLLSRSSGTAKVKTSDDAVQAMNQLSMEKSVQDLLKAFSFLHSDPEVVSDKISSAGFGWGGWRNYLFAEAADDLSKMAVFCGGTPSEGLADIQAPALAHYAQFDFRITGNSVWTAKTMKELGKQFTYYVYPRLQHDFFNPDSPDYDAEAAKLAWTRTLEFLRSP